MHLWINSTLYSFFLVIIMDLLQQIEDLVCGKASIVGNRIMVEFTGIRTASELKVFMFKNGFDYVYGT